MSLHRVFIFVLGTALLVLRLLAAPSVLAQEATTIAEVKNSWTLHELPTFKVAGTIKDTWSTQLINQDTGTRITHTVVYDQSGAKTKMYVRPEETQTVGAYVFSVANSVDEAPFFTDSFAWTDPVVAAGTYTITRNQLPTIIKPDVTYHGRITIHATEAVTGSLVEKVPFDAVPTATEASIIKRPELLNLHKPFDGDYPMSLEFGHVNPVDHLGMPYHDGTDYAIPAGTLIRAVDDGEVIPYREINSYGTTVAIQHAWGRSYYGHLSSSSAILGAHVKKGDVVGVSGNTGLSTGPHLHFAMVWGDEQFVDPDPHINRISPQPSNQKELVWPLSLKKGETKTVEYTFVLPTQDDTSIVTNTIGPAGIVNQQSACRPPFVSQSLLTHYEKNDEQSSGNAEEDQKKIETCPVIMRESTSTTVLSSQQFGQAQSPTTIDQPEVLGVRHSNSGIQSSEPDASNVTPSPRPSLPQYPTTYLENTRFWYNPSTISIEGIDDISGESWSQIIGKKDQINLTLDTHTYHVQILPDNTLRITKKG